MSRKSEDMMGESLLTNRSAKTSKRRSVGVATPGSTSMLPKGQKSEDYKESSGAEHQKQICLDCKIDSARESGFRAQLFMFLEGETYWGGWFEIFILLLIVVNVSTFILGTEEDIMTPEILDWFNYIEVISVVIFTVEYFGRFWTCVESTEFPTRFSYSISFFSIVDLLAIVPFYIDLITPGDVGTTIVVRIFRLFRLLKAEHYVEAFTVFDNVYRRNKGLLKTTGFVAFGLWIIMSVLFYYSEKDNKHMEGAFTNIPDAMFYTAVFFGGEWCRMDFFWTGKVLGVFMIVFGIALYAIPIGILSEGFEAIATERKEMNEKRAGTKVVCARCGKDIKFFPKADRLSNDDE